MAQQKRMVVLAVPYTYIYIYTVNNDRDTLLTASYLVSII